MKFYEIFPLDTSQIKSESRKYNSKHVKKSELTLFFIVHTVIHSVESQIKGQRNELTLLHGVTRKVFWQEVCSGLDVSV